MTKKILTSVDIKGTTVFRDDVTVDAPHLFEVGGDAIYWGPVTDANHVATKAYVDSKVSGQEVFIGTSDPGVGYDLWYDTDDVGGSPMTQNDADTRYAFGIVGYAQVVANQTPITTIIDLTGLSVTFTAAAGRSYKVTGSTFPASSVVDGMVRMYITNSANAILQIADMSPRTAGTAFVIQRSVILSTLSGSTTLKLRMERGGGATGVITNYADPQWPSFILVEDMGIL